MAATSPPKPAPPPPREEAAARFATAFKHASAAVRRLRGRDTHRPGELSYAQFSLLFGLAELGELSASELAGHADVTPASATQMLDGLAAAGLIERRRSERDRRSVLVSLTQHGNEAVAQRRARYHDCWAQALSPFSAAELSTAAEVLDSVRAMFDGLAASQDGGLASG